MALAPYTPAPSFRMSRALTTGLSIALAAVLAGAAWQWAKSDAPELPSIGTDPIADTSSPERFVAPVAPGKDAPRAWVEVLVTQRIRPVGERIEVVRNGEPIRAEASVIAGVGGPFTASSQRVGAALVRVRANGRERHRRVSRRDDGVLSVALGPERTVRGRVVDQQAKPIANASVWCGGAPTEVTTTDADGRFEALVESGPGVPIVVRAEGKAHKHAFVQVGATMEADVPFVLLDSIAALVQAAGTIEALRDAEVAVVPIGVHSTELQTYPFFAQGLWSDTAVDAEGRAVLRGLPRGVQVGVLLLGPGVCRAAPVEVALLGDAPVHVTLSAPERTRVKVEVVDERMQPLSGCEVRCEPQDRADSTADAGSWLLPEWLPPRGGSVFVRGGGMRELAVLHAQKPVRIIASDGVVVGETEPFMPSSSTVRVVLPQRALGRAALVVPPVVSGSPWAVRVDPTTKGEFVDALADEAHVAELDGPMVVDVRVRIPDGAAWSAPREQRSIAVIEPTGLSPSLFAR